MLWTGVKEAINTAWATISGWFDNTVWKPLKKAFDPVWQAISKLWDDISEPIKEVWEAVKDAISPVIESIKGVIQGVIDIVSSVIGWFEQLMGYDGKDLSETTSGHTHTNTTINRVINDGMANFNESTGALDAGVNAVAPLTGQNPDVVTSVWDSIKTALGWKNNAKGNWAVPYDDFCRHRIAKLMVYRKFSQIFPQKS